VGILSWANVECCSIYLNLAPCKVWTILDHREVLNLNYKVGRQFEYLDKHWKVKWAWPTVAVGPKFTLHQPEATRHGLAQGPPSRTDASACSCGDGITRPDRRRHSVAVFHQRPWVSHHPSCTTLNHSLIEVKTISFSISLSPSHSPSTRLCSSNRSLVCICCRYTDEPLTCSASNRPGNRPRAPKVPHWEWDIPEPPSIMKNGRNNPGTAASSAVGASVGIS
jgi:hypothetical protein